MHCPRSNALVDRGLACFPFRKTTLSTLHATENRVPGFAISVVLTFAAWSQFVGR